VKLVSISVWHKSRGLEDLASRDKTIANSLTGRG
jgi:hypothetical protein